MKTIFRIFVVVLFFAHPVFLAAHDGHTSQHSESTRIWRYQDKSYAEEGSFLFFKDGRVYVTNVNGAVVSLALDQLSWMDKNYVKRKIKRIEKINGVQVYELAHDERLIEKVPIFMSIAIALTFLVVVAWNIAFHQFRFHSYSINKGIALIGFSSFVLFLFGCKDEVATLVASIKADPTTINNAFAPYSSIVSTRWDDTYFYVESNGIPSHNMMVGITNWQQQVPIPQSYKAGNAWSIPLTSELSTNPLSTKTNFMKGAIAIAVNGIPIFNPLNNRGEDSYLIGELDQWGGHCGKADDYHYHIPPIHLKATSGTLPIAYALDGYAVYGSSEPDGSSMLALDDYHGHAGSDGVYHYHATTTYPYMIGAMRGKVTLDPATSAPENQILPQATTKPIRPSLTPLTSAKIINFSAPNSTGYSLEYQINAKSGFVNYSWDNTKYTFVFIDTNGNTITQTYPK